MSAARRQLFVGHLDNATWTSEKLRAYFIKHGTQTDEQYVVACRVMSYGDVLFEGESFAFIEFNDEACVDYCMSKRAQFLEDQGIKIKRLLPDSISKCERLTASPDIVIRLNVPDSLFTEVNIRSYFGKYGTIIAMKMLEEEGTAGICLITFDDNDSTDRVLLDNPHSLNGKDLCITKYDTPEYVLRLSQFRPLEERDMRKSPRWHSTYRNLSGLMEPIHLLYKTQLALRKYELDQRMNTLSEDLNKTKEELSASENAYNDAKQNHLNLMKNNQSLKEQIDAIQKKNQTIQTEYEQQIVEQRQKNQLLQETVASL